MVDAVKRAVNSVAQLVKMGFGGVVERGHWGVSVNEFHTEASFFVCFVKAKG